MAQEPTPYGKAVVDLEKYVDDRLRDLIKAIDDRLGEVYKNIDLHASASNRAVEVADTANSRVQLLMNEFRNTIADMTKTLLTQAVYEEFKKGIVDRVGALELAKAKSEGKASVEDVNKLRVFTVIGLLFGGIGMLLSIIGLILRMIGM